MGPENIFKDHEEQEKWLMRSKNFESDVWVTAARFFFNFAKEIHLLCTLISKQQRADFAPLK